MCIPLHKLFIFFQVFCCEPLQLWVWVLIFLYHFISTTDLFLISRRLVSSITCWLFLCIILLTCCLCWFWCLISSWLLCWLCNLISCLQQTRRRGINGDWRPLQGLWLFPFFFFLPPLFLAQRVCLNPTLFEQLSISWMCRGSEDTMFYYWSAKINGLIKSVLRASPTSTEVKEMSFGNALIASPTQPVVALAFAEDGCSGGRFWFARFYVLIYLDRSPLSR